MDRAYSFLTVRHIDEERREISGVATTPGLDRVGDSVDPLGATFRSPLPLLWHHKHDEPVGLAYFEKPTRDGIKFTAKMPRDLEPGTLRDRIDEAWQSVKTGLVRAVSIGFRALDDGIERMDGGGLRFTKTEILELSLVSIPANAEATIQSVKLFDQGARPAAALPRPPPKLSAAETELRSAESRVVEIKRALSKLDAEDLEDWQDAAACGVRGDMRRRLKNELTPLLKRRTELKIPEAAAPREEHGEAAPTRQRRSWQVNDDLAEPILPENYTALPDATRKDLQERIEEYEENRLSKIARDIGVDPDRPVNWGFFVKWMAQGNASEVLLRKRDASNERRLDELEATGFKYCGVYQRALAYRRGSGVTSGGSLWVSLRDVAPGHAPAEGSGWQLCVKRGADGKDAR